MRSEHCVRAAGYRKEQQRLRDLKSDTSIAYNEHGRWTNIDNRHIDVCTIVILTTAFFYKALLSASSAATKQLSSFGDAAGHLDSHNYFHFRPIINLSALNLLGLLPSEPLQPHCVATARMAQLLYVHGGDNCALGF